MDRLKNDGEGTTPETQNNGQTNTGNSKGMPEKRAENAEKDKNDEGLLLAIDGAKIKFNAHLGEFKVLSDVPTTQDKLTGTIVEKQVANFTFYDGFKMISLAEWQDFGTVKVQDNYVLLKKSTLPGIGKMPGNIPPETGKIEFITSGQINVPEKVNAVGAPVPEQKDEKCEYCNKLTKDELKAIFTTSSDDVINKVLAAFNEGMKYFEINTCLRKAHFFAQALKEVGTSFTIKVPENLNYRTDGLINGYWYAKGNDWIKGDAGKGIGGYYAKGTKKATINFSYTKSHPEIAEKYGRKDLNKYGDGGVQKANSEMLANYIYADRLGNGNPESGDGNKYRGKGLIQLTGRSNYESVNKEMQKFNSGLEDILKNPNQILIDVKLAVFSAMGFWKVNKINNVIKKDTSDNIVYKVTNIVNSGEDAPNKLKRYNNFKDITKKVFKINECKNKSL